MGQLGLHLRAKPIEPLLIPVIEGGLQRSHPLLQLFRRQSFALQTLLLLCRSADHFLFELAGLQPELLVHLALQLLPFAIQLGQTLLDVRDFPVLAVYLLLRFLSHGLEELAFRTRDSGGIRNQRFLL